MSNKYLHFIFPQFKIQIHRLGFFPSWDFFFVLYHTSVQCKTTITACYQTLREFVLELCDMFVTAPCEMYRLLTCIALDMYYHHHALPKMLQLCFVTLSAMAPLSPVFINTFHWIGPLGRFSHRVAMSVCLCVSLRNTLFRSTAVSKTKKHFWTAKYILQLDEQDTRWKPHENNCCVLFEVRTQGLTIFMQYICQYLTFKKNLLFIFKTFIFIFFLSWKGAIK